MLTLSIRPNQPQTLTGIETPLASSTGITRQRPNQPQTLTGIETYRLNRHRPPGIEAQSTSNPYRD